MANSEHLEWLKKGANAWNRLRQRQPFFPDLSSEDISRNLGGHERKDIRQISVDLEQINLSAVNLSNATLRDTNLARASFLTGDLTNANLIGSTFEEAMLLNVNAQNAKLFSTDFRKARIWHSDLRLAQFNGSNLEGAQLWNCNLQGAHLYSTNLIGANFSQSRPWTARLFLKPEQTEVDSSILDKEGIKGVEELICACREFRKKYREEIVLYFRGESDSSWDLRPSIMRTPSPGRAGLRSFESEILNDLMTRQPEEFILQNSALSKWVFAQHHGLRTRLLDITRNPLVALFSACNEFGLKDGCLHVFAVPRSLIKPFNSDTISVIANFAKLPRSKQNVLLGRTQNDAPDEPYPQMETSQLDYVEAYPKAMNQLYSMIQQDKPHFEKRIDIRDFFRVIVVEPEQKFQRVRAQAGAFLISAFHERFERKEVLRVNNEVPIYAHYFLRIPRDQKQAILEDLSLLNVARETLFPGIDEAARAVIERFENRKMGV